MKRLLYASLLTVALTTSAVADNIQIDQTFTKTQQWLSRENLALTGSPSARDDLAAFSQDALLFYGEGVGNPEHRTPAQRELMAKRAAEITAKRQVVEYMEGFALVGDTLVKDGMTQYDVVRSAVIGFVKGVQVVFQEYDKDKDMAIAIVKVGLHGPKGYASLLYEKLLSDPKLKQQIVSDKPQFKAKPAPLSEKFDGLVIDATDQDFRPALINRIFTPKGEILYDPARISQKVLVEQGCGEYTNSIDKAKAALATRGVKNPLVVKAAGSVSKADLKVTDEDAVAIFTANQQNGFLAGAKVAFVLK